MVVVGAVAATPAIMTAMIANKKMDLVVTATTTAVAIVTTTMIAATQTNTSLAMI